MQETEKHRLRIVPEDTIVFVEEGRSLLEALIGGGYFLRADCGGKGRCGKCLVRLTDASITNVSPPGETEIREIGSADLDKGYRLACQVIPYADLSLEIPDSSRLSVEVGQKGPTILPEHISASPPPGQGVSPYGLAVDLGTTTLAVYLCDLHRGSVVATMSVGNPQAMFGDDVMSRISAVTRASDTLNRLQRMVVKAIEWGTKALCQSTRIDPVDIRTCTVVGNSTMIHIFVGESPESIGRFPYDPLFVEDRTFRGETLGFSYLSSAEIYTLPLISGFLGSDILVAALAVDLEDTPVGTMLVDVGTNGEVMLVGKDGLLATSCATGPAFEGATIRHGMHAVSGAIDSVRFNSAKDHLAYSIIQKESGNHLQPSGICGTGVVSAVAELFRSGFVSSDGRLDRDLISPYLNIDENGLPEFVLVPAEKSHTHHAITLTQKDVRSIQLAKGALLTGMELLCLHAGQEQPEKLLVAGAFGSFIDKADALTIGMFPPLAEEDLSVVGNAAGAGAVLTLFDFGYREKARSLARKTSVIDLASTPEFQTAFLKALNFPT